MRPIQWCSSLSGAIQVPRRERGKRNMNLAELKEIARKRAATFGTVKLTCLHTVLLAIQDALKDVDSIDYATTNLMKATTSLAYMGHCGVYTAGGIALSLKYGSEEYTDWGKGLDAGWKAMSYGDWFKKQFGSLNCFDLSGGADFSNMEGITAYTSSEEKKEQCRKYCVAASQKLIELLTESE